MVFVLVLVACDGTTMEDDAGPAPRDGGSDGGSDGGGFHLDGGTDASAPDANVSTDATVAGDAGGSAADAGLPDAGPRVPECATSSDPLAAPDGITPHVLTWEEALCGATFPDVLGYPCPIGSFSIDERIVREHGVAIEFVAPDTAVTLTWIEAQPVSFFGYPTGRPATAAFVGISECPLDRRAAISASAPERAEDENLLRTACRKYTQAGSIYFGPTPSFNACGLVPGRTYYLNVLFVDEALEPTCYSGDRCEANFQ